MFTKTFAVAALIGLSAARQLRHNAPLVMADKESSSQTVKSDSTVKPDDTTTDKPDDTTTDKTDTTAGETEKERIEREKQERKEQQQADKEAKQQQAAQDKRDKNTKEPGVQEFDGDDKSTQTPPVSVAGYCEGTFDDGSTFFIGASGREGWDKDILIGWGKGLCGTGDVSTMPFYTVTLGSTDTTQGFNCDYKVTEKGVVNAEDGKPAFDKSQTAGDEGTSLISIDKDVTKDVKLITDDAEKEDIVILDPLMRPKSDVKGDVESTFDTRETEVKGAFDDFNTQMMDSLDATKNSIDAVKGTIDTQKANLDTATTNVKTSTSTSISDSGVNTSITEKTEKVRDDTKTKMENLKTDLDDASAIVDSRKSEVQDLTDTAKADVETEITRAKTELNDESTGTKTKDLDKVNQTSEKNLSKQLSKEQSSIQKKATDIVSDANKALKQGFSKNAKQAKKETTKALNTMTKEITKEIKRSGEDKTAQKEAKQALTSFKKELTEVFNDDDIKKADKKADKGSFTKEANTQKKESQTAQKEKFAAEKEEVRGSTEKDTSNAGATLPDAIDLFTDLSGNSVDIDITVTSNSAASATCKLSVIEQVDGCKYGPMDDLKFYYKCSLAGGRYLYGGEEYDCTYPPSVLFCGDTSIIA